MFASVVVLHIHCRVSHQRETERPRSSTVCGHMFIKASVVLKRRLTKCAAVAYVHILLRFELFLSPHICLLILAPENQIFSGSKHVV
jgi:hypothetical protein